jgi:EAL domain-containing protein (putative c-di-GMP-specific phosphodiesterase class I)
VVAEGVEDSTIWNKLEQLGCDLAQGSFFCLPVPAADLSAELCGAGPAVDT